MKRLVLDSSAFLTWFAAERVQLRADYESGSLEVHVPNTFRLDVLEHARRERRLDADALARLATELGRLGFREHATRAESAASWIERGLDARSAAYAALAADLDVRLISADRDLVGRVPQATDVGDA